MPIPASQIVQVNPRLISPGGDDLQFNALFLTTNPVIPMSEFVQSFASAEDVGAYFGLDSNEYNLAAVYFQGYDDSFKKPDQLFFAPYVNSALAPFIRGGEGVLLSDLQSVTDGTLEVTFNGVTASLTGIDFSEVTSLSGAAAIIQTALQAETGTQFTAASVTYSSVFDAFTITSGDSGSDDSVVLPGGSLASTLKLTDVDGAVLSQGSDVLTIAENMQLVLANTRNFVTFMTIDAVSSDEAVEFADWAASQGPAEYLYVFWDNNIQNTSANPIGTIAQALTEANAGACAGIYGTAEYGAFVCSIAACVNYNRANGAITFKFKGQSGLAANVTDGTTATRLDALGMNFIGNYATRNDSFVFLANGEMFGEWKWIDSYLNAIFLNSALQTACMAGLSQSPRTPFTPAGYNQVLAWLQDPINRALQAGVIDTGVTINELQRAQLMRETGGTDISTYLTNDGYYVMVHEAAASVRQARGPLTVSLWYAYGGAVHRLIVESTAVV